MKNLIDSAHLHDNHRPIESIEILIKSLIDHNSAYRMKIQRQRIIHNFASQELENLKKKEKQDDRLREFDNHQYVKFFIYVLLFVCFVGVA